MIPDPFACVEIGCLFLEIATLAECERSRCCWAYARRREEKINPERRHHVEELWNKAAHGRIHQAWLIAS
ncbi:hypothetical protein [Candidatus Deferrimicrobium sp.]|uniref:hypothetical protein n=1 Tax=Candidatus Deferrimicrobium sp. TaxID=3060586 RepID=UPI002727D546|nr:hypothetical protein [Candidatus Deferrimicrobium sp.]MDO8739417.1 hypothetical protein [Candidatus Deferrimicrobium sp.]